MIYSFNRKTEQDFCYCCYSFRHFSVCHISHCNEKQSVLVAWEHSPLIIITCLTFRTAKILVSAWVRKLSKALTCSYYTISSERNVRISAPETTEFLLSLIYFLISFCFKYLGWCCQPNLDLVSTKECFFAKE